MMRAWIASLSPLRNGACLSQGGHSGVEQVLAIFCPLHSAFLGTGLWPPLPPCFLCPYRLKDRMQSALMVGLDAQCRRRPWIVDFMLLFVL